MGTVHPDVVVRLRGHAMLFEAESEAARRWFVEECPEDLRYAFEARRYGDTPYGWFPHVSESDLERLGMLLDRHRFTTRVEV